MYKRQISVLPEDIDQKAEVDGQHRWCEDRMRFFHLRCKPVSYTHLDVYKRQLKDCLRDGVHTHDQLRPCLVRKLCRAFRIL